VISLSPSAAAQIRAAQVSKGIAGFGLRVQVVGGGCEGFLYDLLYVDQPEPEDTVFESEGLKLFVDPRVLQVVRGLKIDAHSDGFQFENPSARHRCSCGASFSV
jgi:iron-sulfur cluster assembly accessory protein